MDFLSKKKKYFKYRFVPYESDVFNIKNSARHSKYSTRYFRTGFGLIEIVIGATILSTSLLGISSYYQQALQVSQQTGNSVQVAFLMEEGMEIAKIFRDTSWTNISGLTMGATYYLTWNGTTWATTTTNTFVDGMFERTLVVDDVYRDGNDDIVTSGGTIDDGVKKATVYVSWNERGATTTKSISTYITDFFN
ncbi:MAG: hypothetical protein Q7S11_03765 [bacterium]|nr:hypothetical protein [bacterium]